MKLAAIAPDNGMVGSDYSPFLLGQFRPIFSGAKSCSFQGNG